MKILKITSLFAFIVMFFAYCTKTDQVVVSATPNTTDLIALKTTTAPTLDGAIDAAWDKAQKLSITMTVPDPGNNLFAGYNGIQYKTTLRAMYDDQYVYFLAEYNDPDKSVNVTPWYFNPTTALWVQEGSSRTYDANGVLTREGWGEDKFAMLWNIDKSTPKFETQTCYASCHVFTPYLNYAVTPAAMVSNAGSGNHYTNGAQEKIDMWWAHLSKDILFGQMDDNYQDWAGGPGVTGLVGGSGNGRHVDGITVSGANTTWPYAPTYTTTPAQGGYSNKQTLKLNGTGASVSVPMWVVPGEANYYILAADTLAGGKAKKVTGVSATGVLTYSGGTIDPTTGSDYLRTDGVTGATAPKAIPSYIGSALLGERADISAKAVHTGTGWIVEYKRKLKTADVLKQDVDFSSLEDKVFGVALWDRSNNQHAIQPNLTMKFAK